MDYLLRRRKWILLITAAAGLSTFAYRVEIAKLIGAVFSLADAASSASEIAALLSSDLNIFIRSDSDEIPSSLRQLSKISASDEFSGSVSRVSECLTAGIVRAIQSREGNESPAVASLPDRVLEKLFTTAGSRFSSIVVGSFAKNLVLAYYSRGAEGVGVGPETPSWSGWADVVCAEQSRRLIAVSIQAFVGTAMGVFLDKTMHINTYNELFAGLTNPQHEARMKEMLISVCNGAMETLVRTSHRVLTTSGPSLSASSVESFSGGVNLENGKESSSSDREGNEWVSQVSSTLDLPSNMKFVLDVAGRMTFETVRSVLEISMLKVSDGVHGMISTGQEAAEKGMAVMRYVSASSIVIVTLCFVLCMHVFAGTRSLVQV